MPKNTVVPRLETLIGLTEVGLTIGAIATKESLKAARTVTTDLGRFVGRQSLQALQRGVEATDAHSHSLSLRRRKEREQDITREEAMEKFVLGLLEYPHDSHKLAKDFDLVVKKLKSVNEVSDGIRTREGREGIVPMSYITSEYTLQLASMSEEFGVDKELSAGWTQTLRQFAGLEPEQQQLRSEQQALNMLLWETRQSVRESAPVTV